MTDEIEIAAPAAKPKRRGGWTKGKARKTIADVKAAADRADPTAMQMSKMKLKMKAKPNWEESDFGQDLGTDLLGISQDVVDSLARDGVALQWATKTVYGQEQTREMRQTFAAGWTPCHLGDFDGVFDDGKFAPKGADQNIEVGSCMLVARPIAMHQKAKLAQRREANEPLERTKLMAAQGIPGVSGGNHASVRNQINVGIDRGIEIPD